MLTVATGNKAVAAAVKEACPSVVAAYPITPQTEIVEQIAEYVTSGELKSQYIPVESEHSAMAACIGASIAGARTFTATSAQGLALMHELLHWASGGRLPIVMGDINRAMAPGWSIWTDQNDSLSQRDTGWMQFYVSSNQEVVDTTIQAFKIAEAIGIPAMVVLDAFALSHTYEVVDIPEQDKVDAYLPPYKPYARLTPDAPCAFDGLTGPEHYFELRYKLQKDMEKVPALFDETGREFEKIFGRRLEAVEPYLCDDAEIILVTSGTAGFTARVAVDEMRKEGIKIGNLRIRMFRPFPFDAVRRILAKASKIAVLDRNISYGYHGIFCQEVKSALNGSGSSAPVFGFIAGLGGRDIMAASFREIVDIVRRQDKPAEEINWIGVKK